MNFDTDKIKVENTISEEDLDKILRSDPVYVNRVFIHAGKDGIVRLIAADMIDGVVSIVDGEKTEKQSLTVKSSIVMTFAGILTLKKLLDDFIQRQMVATNPMQSIENRSQREELN